MRTTLWLVAIIWCTAPMAMAGPNAGGVLLVHKTDLVYSTDTPGPPYGGPDPTDCNSVNVQAPLGVPPVIWKVYAAFPAGSSPRLQGLAWGMDITPQGGGYITMATGGMVNGSDFEVTQDGWPTTNDGSIGQSFPTSGTKTTLMTEVYWFGGYAYGGLNGTDVQYFCAQPHAVQASMFVDDAPIKNSDPIANYGCLGFGGPGHVHCPPVTPEPGRCCQPDGSCTVTVASACIGGAWTAGLTCEPHTCEQPTGSCCFIDDSCTITLAADCTVGSYWIMFGTCGPTDCIPWTGACCGPDGSCVVSYERDCPWLSWIPSAVCSPNPCEPSPQEPGACCIQACICRILTPAACGAENGLWIGTSCTPHPMACTILSGGACCLPDGTCITTSVCECWTAGGGFMDDISCDPDPCRSTPIERKSWGQLKNRYR